MENQEIKGEKMTYRALLASLKKFSEEDLDKDVTIFHDDLNAEFYPATSVGVVEETDVLDKGHPVIVIGEISC